MQVSSISVVPTGIHFFVLCPAQSFLISPRMPFNNPKREGEQLIWQHTVRYCLSAMNFYFIHDNKFLYLVSLLKNFIYLFLLKNDEHWCMLCVHMTQHCLLICTDYYFIISVLTPSVLLLKEIIGNESIVIALSDRTCCLPKRQTRRWQPANIQTVICLIIVPAKMQS